MFETLQVSSRSFLKEIRNEIGMVLSNFLKRLELQLGASNLSLFWSFPKETLTCFSVWSFRRLVQNRSEFSVCSLSEFVGSSLLGSLSWHFLEKMEKDFRKKKSAWTKFHARRAYAIWTSDPESASWFANSLAGYKWVIRREIIRRDYKAIHRSRCSVGITYWSHWKYSLAERTVW